MSIIWGKICNNYYRILPSFQFKKEERLNLKLINKALLFPKEFNIEELKQQFQEEDEEIERQREQERQIKAEAEEKLKQQKMSKK